MRSILKSHKRNDSTSSDINNSLETPHIRTHVKRTDSTPRLEQHEKFTSPTVASSFQQSSLSSPKKLLSPIKKMFGHHSKPAVAPPSNETLQSLMKDEIGPNSKNQTLNKNQEPSAEIPRRKNPGVASVKLEGCQALYTSKMKELRSIDIPKYQLEQEKQQGLHKGGPQDIVSPIVSANASNLSISTSKSSLRVPAVAKETTKTTASETIYNSDGDSKDSDVSSQSSSQFSFVKDIRGGRNTSVKYYKTRPTSGAKEGRATEYLNIDDMGFEADGLSDYDFENNGIDDEGDFEDEFQDGRNRYDDFISENDYGDNHGSDDRVGIAVSALRSPGYAGDFLDTYLEAGSPTKTPNQNTSCRPNSSDPFTKSHSTSSPIDVGLGLGFIEMPGDILSEPESLEAVTSMMDTLRRLEGSPKIHEAHQAMLGSESGLEPRATSDRNVIESSAEIRHEKDLRDAKRKSVAEMMSMLSFLENGVCEDERVTSHDNISTSIATHHLPEKRYSWLTNEDSFGQNEPNRLPNMGGSNYDPFDQDILDEVNLLPENFDFSDEDRSLGNQKSIFFRSNSYNKKPTKLAPHYSSDENKLELRNKTVTFFRSKSLDLQEKGRNKEIGRVTSIRSVTSFNDEDISEGDEEAYSDCQETTINQLLIDSNIVLRKP